MSIHNPKMSLENAANRLYESAETARLIANKRRGFSRKFYNSQSMWQEYKADEPVGEPFQASQKEVKMMRQANEKQFLKALSKLKPGQAKPKLADYRLLLPVAEDKVEPKKLWEP
jgi:hypothetical protein